MKEKDKLAVYQAKQQVIANRRLRQTKDNKLALVASLAAITLALGSQLLYFGVGPGSQGASEEIASDASVAESQESEALPSSDPQAPDASLAEDRTWQGSMSIGSEPVAFDLHGDLAPQATANFVSLANEGYFEGLTCHRLTTAGIYVLQCGDPNGDGTGGPGYSWGPIENAPIDDVYPPGTIAMARRGGDDYSMGSQFFIVYETSQIPSDSVGGYSVFGTVTEGLEAIQAIANAGVFGGGTDGSPVEPVVIADVSVE